MKKLFLKLLIGILLFQISCSENGQLPPPTPFPNVVIPKNWKKLTTIPLNVFKGSPNYDLAFYAACNGKLYTGLNSFSSDIWEYDPTSEKWLLKTQSPIANPSIVAHFVLDSKIYFQFESAYDPQTGNREYLRDFYEYNPSLNTWTRKADFPSTGASIVKQGCSFGGNGYLLLGLSPVGTNGEFTRYNEVRVYDPLQDVWSQLSDFPGIHRNYPAIYQDDSGICMAGGRDQNGPRTDQWKFDPLLNQWERITDLPGSSPSLIFFQLNGNQYYGFGYNKDFWVYTSLNGQWSTFLKSDFSVYGNTSTIGNKGYLLDSKSRSIWEFDPSL